MDLAKPPRPTWERGVRGHWLSTARIASLGTNKEYHAGEGKLAVLADRPTWGSQVSSQFHPGVLAALTMGHHHPESFFGCWVPIVDPVKMGADPSEIVQVR